MSTNHIELKIKLIRFFEIAYKTDGTVTAAIVKDKGPFSLSIDNTGQATLYGKSGVVKFSVNEEIKEYGIDFRYVRVMFSGNSKGIIIYKASFGIGAEIAVGGMLDVEKLLLNCSGLLCIAARALKFRTQMIDKSIAASLGN